MVGKMVLEHAENPPTSKTIDSCQPALVAQADMGRYFLLMHKPSFLQNRRGGLVVTLSAS